MTLANCRSIAQYLAACSSQKFTGTLCLRSAEGTMWSLRFFIGRMIGEAGGVAPLGRWKRHLLRAIPSFDWQAVTSAFDLTDLRLQWNTELLEHLLQNNELDRRQATSVFRSCAIDVLFDIALAEEQASAKQLPPPTAITIPCSRISGNKSLMIPLDVDDVWESASNHLDRWMEANGKYESPNLVPAIVLPDLLEKLVSADMLRLFSQLMDGKHSLRDIAAVLGKTTDMVYLSLCPFILANAIQLGPELDVVTALNPDAPQCRLQDEPCKIETDDSVALSSTRSENQTVSKTTNRQSDNQRNVDGIGREPIDSSIEIAENTSDRNVHKDSRDNDVKISRQLEISSTQPNAIQAQQPAIAYIDDNSEDSQRMQSVLGQLGCTRMIDISDPTLAIAALLDNTPDVVFLGLENACDICLQIRKISPLKHIPIAIVSRNDGVLERFRARLAGAIGLVSKPVGENDVALLLHRFYSAAPPLVLQPVALSSIHH